jgi:hypothetical protein
MRRRGMNEAFIQENLDARDEAEPQQMHDGVDMVGEAGSTV